MKKLIAIISLVVIAFSAMAVDDYTSTSTSIASNTTSIVITNTLSNGQNWYPESVFVLPSSTITAADTITASIADTNLTTFVPVDSASLVTNGVAVIDFDNTCQVIPGGAIKFSTGAGSTNAIRNLLIIDRKIK